MTPRRRPFRRLDGAEEPTPELRTTADVATDVTRFAGLGPEWFWVDEFMMPESTFWAKENAAAVAALRQDRWTHERLAEHFRVSVPTIRKALKIAAAADPALQSLPRKIPRGRWAEAHGAEVARKRGEGLTMKQLAEHFGKSEPIILQALRYAAQQLGGIPDDRRPKSVSEDSHAATE
jgi:uncharacterized protein (DUF433 family)